MPRKLFQKRQLVLREEPKPKPEPRKPVPYFDDEFIGKIFNEPDVPLTEGTTPYTTKIITSGTTTTTLKAEDMYEITAKDVYGTSGSTNPQSLEFDLFGNVVKYSTGTGG